MKRDVISLTTNLLKFSTNFNEKRSVEGIIFCFCIRPVKELFMHSLHEHHEGEEDEDTKRRENTCLHLTLVQRLVNNL